MLKNKFEKQPSGIIPLSFDQTPHYKGYEIPSKDFNDQFSYTLKSNNDIFGNAQGIEDYEFGHFTFKGDKSWKNQSSSPMTRRQRAKELENNKEDVKGLSPNKFVIDWDKMTHCPCWKQRLPK